MSNQADSLGEAIARAVPIDADPSTLRDAKHAIELRLAGGVREERCPDGYGPFDTCPIHDA